ncbi:MAG: hypothetical protein RSF40_01565 [Oscillospiraceae bacterium]
MSILQEYEAIKKSIGREKCAAIEKFLDAHPQYLLSDVLYKSEVWDEMEEWVKSNLE